MAQAQELRAQDGWSMRLRFCYWLARGLWVEPRVIWLARSLALY